MLSLEKHLQHYWNRVVRREPNECWGWIGAKNWKGYGVFRWNNKNQNAHRVAWILANGPIPDGIHCLHKCDNRECQNPAHLFLGTNLDNIADKVAKGRQRGPRGERSATAKLKASEIPLIVRRAESGEPYESIAKDFGVTDGHISNIMIGRTWTCVTGFKWEKKR